MKLLNFLRIGLAACVFSGVLVLGAGSAQAAPFDFTRALTPGLSGGDVKALQVRIAGWYPSAKQGDFKIDGQFSAATTRALKAFQRHYKLTVDGVAGPKTFKVLEGLEDKDGSTTHFDFSEFDQNSNSSCSAKANAYAGTLAGGLVSPRIAKRNVRRLMWRLEALRAKGGDNPIGINSGFRSTAYNDCIGGASASQHLYGDAADNRMANVDNHSERVLAKGTDFSGIGCYADLSHNHFDLRLDNNDSPSTKFWWWPKQNRRGQDLDDVSGTPCWGEKAKTQSARAGGGDGVLPLTTTRLALIRVRDAVPGAGSLVPSATEVHAFQWAGEPELADSGD